MAVTQLTRSYAVVLARVYAASLGANLPILMLLLTPPLVRSRAGSETMLAIGTTILLGLVIAAVVAAPEVSAWAAPTGPWQFGRARALVSDLIRTGRRTFLLRLGEFAVLYVAGQAVGGLVAWVMPYIWPNPDFGVNPEADRWVLNYPSFAVQAVSMYLVICLATAWYAVRLRQAILARSEPRVGLVQAGASD
jgi:hypothetical protein